MDSTQLGIFLLCLTCLVPLVAGFLLGRWYQDRFSRLGLPGALIPDFIRRMMEGRDE